MTDGRELPGIAEGNPRCRKDHCTSTGACVQATDCQWVTFGPQPGITEEFFRLILCCYCNDTHATIRHCHRYLLVEILEKVAQHHGISFEYVGEVSNRRT